MVQDKSLLTHRKLVYRNKRSNRALDMQVNVYRILKRDLNKIPRIQEHAALHLGVFPQGNDSVRLYAKSVSIAEVTDTFQQFKYAALLLVNENSKKPRFVAVTALAFDNLDDVEDIKVLLAKRFLHSRKRRDSQIERLYDWEAKHLRKLNAVEMTDAQLEKLTRRIIKHFKLPTDRVYVSTAKSRSAETYGLCQTFRDDVAAQNPVFIIVNIHDSALHTLLHETAHMVVQFSNMKGSVQAHGAEFCGVYAYILSTFGGLDETTVVESMRRDGKLKVTLFE